ncbi:unnamed protein product [Cyprideis torosa]|uniref:Uncharacterized protein n=1 Tax=Cyprideis torosa TaxID=163714 RepID=A0A7R8W851_9CRUS|nr:unnamed protein product [Cyprideis torosa]CAG0887098.1 unnamed protein product [Cyprideis torosa]
MLWTPNSQCLSQTLVTLLRETDPILCKLASAELLSRELVQSSKEKVLMALEGELFLNYASPLRPPFPAMSPWSIVQLKKCTVCPTTSHSKRCLSFARLKFGLSGDTEILSLQVQKKPEQF